MNPEFGNVKGEMTSPGDFIRIASASFFIRTADVDYNKSMALKCIEEAIKQDVQLLVLPELCITGACCESLFENKSLLSAAQAALNEIAVATEKSSIVAVVGTPILSGGDLSDVAAIIHKGNVRGYVKRRVVGEKHEFNPYKPMLDIHFEQISDFQYNPYDSIAIGGGYGFKVCFASEVLGTRQLYPHNVFLQKAKTPIKLVLSSINATSQSGDYIMSVLKTQSAREKSAIALASTAGDSTTDFVFDGLCAVIERGEVRREARAAMNGITLTTCDVDMARLNSGGHFVDQGIELAPLKNPAPFISKTPWQSEDSATAQRENLRILDLQAAALAQRASFIGVSGFIVGVSGGLDSAMALVASVNACELLGWPATNVHGISMPGFGTTSRTRDNARILCETLGVTFKEIDITSAVRQHFADIGQNENDHSITFENAQARERTQILLDLSNKDNLLDIGTGDLSEIALGWSTFGGDHMAQFGINSSLLKSQIRSVISAARKKYPNTIKVLSDILETPVSPELLPSKNGQISQKTEDTIGPYAIQDFFVYHFVIDSMTIDQLIERAKIAFDGEYDPSLIVDRADVFTKRFIRNQYKRNCMPEGPNLTGMSLSCRSFAMPSDAYMNAIAQKNK